MDYKKRELMRLAAATPLMALLPTGGASAADFPSRRVQIFVVFPPGGPGDTLARIISPRLSEKWKVPVIVENRPGAAGSVAAAALLREPADGHTLLFTSSTHIQAVGLKFKLSYDPLANFRAIIHVGSVPMVLMVRPDGPRTLQELVALAHRSPVSLGSYGASSTAHIYGELLNKAANLNASNVPYAGGAPQVNAILAGHVTAGFVEGSQAVALAKDGRLRPLALIGPGRYRSLPDVKTFGELGYENFDLRGFHGILVNSQVPDAVAAKLTADIAAVLDEPAIQTRIADMGIDPPVAKGDWNNATRREAAQWTSLIEKSGIKVEQ